MATPAIISASNLDINNVTFGDIRLGKKGGKSVPIKYNGQNLEIRIPKMRYPMGLKAKTTPDGTTAYNLMASLKDCDHYAKEKVTGKVNDVQNLYNFILDLQEKLLTTAATNSAKWFGKSRDKAVLSALMKQSLNPSADLVNGEWVPNGKYPPSLKMKVPVYQTNEGLSIPVSLVCGDQPVKVDDVRVLEVSFPKQVEASIVVAPSVYVSGQGFGITWRISNARTTTPKQVSALDIFRDEIEEDARNESTAPATETLTEEVDEEQHQEEVVVEETPTAPPSAPANRRRKAAAS
jgi:hypothetical protein